MQISATIFFGNNVVAGETLYVFAMLSPICDKRDSDLLFRVVITPYLVSLLSGMKKKQS